MSPSTYEAAIRAVGAGLEAVDEVMSGRVANAFCQVRPPGYHAASTAPWLLPVLERRHRGPLCTRPSRCAERVAVVDFDVHHGNGTQDIFWSDKNLFYGSTHQMPLFGTGALSETGVGNIWNAPCGKAMPTRCFAMFTNCILGPLHNFSPT